MDKVQLVANNSSEYSSIISEAEVKDYLLGSNTKLSDQQFKMFYGIAKAFNLNPFRREIYAIAYGQSFNIVTGYQVYIDRAMKSGMLDGWKAETLRSEDGKIAGAKIIIHRKDWKEPFEWTVDIKEFVKLKADGKPQGQRAVMPEFMIKKVAIGQGFRLAFPNELSGMPYLPEEITDKRESFVAGESVLVEHLEEPKPVVPITATANAVINEFKETIGFDTLSTSTWDVAATKLKILWVAKWLKDKYCLIQDSQEHNALLAVYDEAISLLANRQKDGE